MATVRLVTGTAEGDAVIILHQGLSAEVFKDAAIASDGFEEGVGLAVISPTSAISVSRSNFQLSTGRVLRLGRLR